MKIFHILCFFLLIFSLFQSGLNAGEFPEIRTKETDLFPRPSDGHIAEINPPGFSWLPVNDAKSYMISITNTKSKQLIINDKIIDGNVYVCRKALPPGDYEWILEAFDAEGKSLAKRRPYKLYIPPGLIEQPMPDIQKLLAGVNRKHPRLIFLKDNLVQIRKSLLTTRKEAWEILKVTADSCLDMPAPKPPSYGRFDIKTQFAERRMEYQSYYRKLRPAIDKALLAHSLAWLMTEDEKYAIAGKRILLEIATWDPKGITSCNISSFDEVGLSLSRCVHRAYDWLYDALSAEEKELVRKNVIARARDTFQRVGIDRPFHRRPGSSHDGRLIGYLGEQAIALVGEAPDEEVEQWLEYSIEAFMTVYPHWGGNNGGWAEGMDYGPRYSMFIAPWIESLLAVSDVNLWQRPFFRNVRNFFTSCTRPNAERKPFGDGAEIGLLTPNRHTNGLAAYLRLHAYRFNDPVCQWWAEQLPLPKTYIYYPVIPLVPEFKHKAPPPLIKSKANYFNDVGWCALHSDYSDLENDVFLLFKSSPFASVSHSHGDQNAFHISVGGRALAIASGYYGPVYGMPHHADWTRATKANNCILVNGKGQAVRDFTAKGRITDFKHEEAVSYVSGDAVQAYKGSFKRCDRHVIFVRPGVFVILDDLEAPEESTYQWLFHALEKIDVDEKNQSLISHRKGACLKVQLFNSIEKDMMFTQTDKFDTPYLEGVPQEYRNELTDYWHETYNKDIIPQWHFTASTDEPKKKLRIAAIMTAGMKEQAMPIEWLSEKGWQGARVQFKDGIAEVWAQLKGNSKLPNALTKMKKSISKDAVVIGIWQPKKIDEVEVIYGERKNDK
jgi:hypothetical protein